MVSRATRGALSEIEPKRFKLSINPVSSYRKANCSVNNNCHALLQNLTQKQRESIKEQQK